MVCSCTYVQPAVTYVGVVQWLHHDGAVSADHEMNCITHEQHAPPTPHFQPNCAHVYIKLHVQNTNKFKTKTGRA